MFKRLIPTFVKSLIWGVIFYGKFSRKNKIGRKVMFAKDSILGSNCSIGNNVKFGTSVVLANNVKVGSGAFLENIVIGDNSSIENIICTGFGHGKIVIGRECYIGLYNVLDWSENITIGDFVHIAGPSTGFWTHTSAPMCFNGIQLSDKNKKYRPTAPITIESNVYIGGNCTIYPGITIGHHSIVAPNSAVTKDVPPFTMVGGVPAKILKSIDYGKMIYSNLPGQDGANERF